MPVDKRAGQRALFTRAFADYQKTDDEDKKRCAAELMAKVLIDAPGNGFTELEVTQGADVPDEVRRLVQYPIDAGEQRPEDAEQLTRELEQRVDKSDCLELGDGNQSVYAYGYSCVSGRMKVGRTDRDVVDRIVRQINESTPDRPALSLVIRTDNARALEKALQGVLEVR
ncbi:MAG TPA: hypothetical protein VGZ29_14215, partial [Terriglobia bacterium]|nr:hypothetical protein [Terriglobia bacterium]